MFGCSSVFGCSATHNELACHLLSPGPAAPRRAGGKIRQRPCLEADHTKNGFPPCRFEHLKQVGLLGGLSLPVFWAFVWFQVCLAGLKLASGGGKHTLAHAMALLVRIMRRSAPDLSKMPVYPFVRHFETFCFANGTETIMCLDKICKMLSIEAPALRLHKAVAACGLQSFRRCARVSQI